MFENPRSQIVFRTDIFRQLTLGPLLKGINDQLRAHVIFISETKINKSYPNDQFKLPGYHMYRRDRKKGAGGLLL